MSLSSERYEDLPDALDGVDMAGAKPVAGYVVNRASALRPLIGKWIEWEQGVRTFQERRGRIEEVKGKNIRISGDWLWLPHMRGIHVIEAPKPQE